MSSSKRPTTVLSTKGQVILPKSIRDERQWSAGTRLIVENASEGVLLRSVPDFVETRFDDVFGCLRSEGRPKTLGEMEKGILTEAKRRHARD
jgi:AbrB family looped-hinge helix DNA binding protein